MYSQPRNSGFTIIEIMVVSLVLIVLTAAAAPAFLNIQDAYMENQMLSTMSLRAQHSMERLVSVTSQALTSDPEFTTLHPATDSGFRALQFRLIDSFAGGAAVYDDSTRVFIVGPEESVPSAGVVIGRGATLGEVLTTAAGADATLGTRDDDTGTLKDDIPVVELLLPDNFAPRTGDMLIIDVSGPRVTITLRLNVLHKGEFVLDEDLVLSERVALQQ